MIPYQIYPTLSGIPDAPAPLNNAHNSNNNAPAISISFKNNTNATTAAGVKPTNASQQQPSMVVTSASAVHDTKQPIEFPSASDSGSKANNKSTSSLVKNPSPAVVTPTVASQHLPSANITTASAVANSTFANDSIKSINNTSALTNSTDSVKASYANNANTTTANVASKTNSTADKNTTTTTAAANSIPVVTVEKVIHPSLKNTSSASSLVPSNKNDSKSA